MVEALLGLFTGPSLSKSLPVFRSLNEKPAATYYYSGVQTTLHHTVYTTTSDEAVLNTLRISQGHGTELYGDPRPALLGPDPFR